MTSDDRVSAARGVIAEVLRLDPGKVRPEVAIHKVDAWNSLTHIELIVALEEKFDLQLTEDEIASMTTVAEIMRVVTSRGAR